MNRILVTGGCGFIGSQVVVTLLEQNYDVIVVDREPKNLHIIPKDIVIKADFQEYLEYDRAETFDTIIHLAAEHVVEKSVRNPAEYYENNVIKLKRMLDVMAIGNAKNIIYSSSCAVNGRQGAFDHLKEDLYYDSENPYASTKIASEMLIKDYSKAYGINYVNFRYFNAAGADPQNRFGYIQRPATHVIPILCNKIMNDEIFKIFGNTYNTPDGTCVRDYIHVQDIANAHVKAIEFLDNGFKNETFNIGNGDGVSVKQLAEYAANIVNKKANIEYEASREGDPGMLVADTRKSKEILKWEPTYSIKDIIQHAWNWENKNNVA